MYKDKDTSRLADRHGDCDLYGNSDGFVDPYEWEFRLKHWFEKKNPSLEHI